MVPSQAAGSQPDFFPLPRPPGPQGFLLRSVARLPRPCLFSTTRESVSLCPLPASGFPYRVGFSVTSLAASHDRAGGSPWVRRTASPDAVRLHIGSVHRISGLALSCLLDLLPNAIEPVRCSLRTWVLPHTSSGPAISDSALVLLVWLFRPVTASVLLPATPEGQRMRHARRTLNPPAMLAVGNGFTSY